MPLTRHETPSREGLVRAIGRWSLVALTINCILGSGIFGLPSVLAALLGRSSVLAVILAAAAIGVVMACFAEVSSRFTETGGPYLYARKAFGQFMGIQVGWLVWFVRLTAGAANVNLFVTYLGEFWPHATEPIPKLAILTALLGILAAINVRGVRAGAGMSTAFTAGKLGALGLVSVCGAVYLIAAHRIVPQSAVSAGSAPWMRAMLLLIFAYGGFEAAVVSAGEAKDPHRDMPFALLAALLTCAVIYALIQWVVVGVLPDPGRSERPLADVARIVLGHSGAGLIALGALFSICGYLSGNVLATPRITFALAEHGDFPSVFARVHPRFRTPYVSIFVFAFLVWLFALFGSFAGNATLSAGSRLFYYGVVCAALPALRRKEKTRAAFHLPGGIALAGLGVLLCAGLLTRIEYNKSLILVAAVAIAVVNWLVVRRRAEQGA